MLKLTYTDVGLLMERSMTTPELLITQHVILAMRLGQPLYTASGRASFLLAADVPELPLLEAALTQDDRIYATVTLTPVGQAFIEVGLSGSWVAQDPQAHTGMFLALLNHRTEFLIYRLWQRSEARASMLA